MLGFKKAERAAENVTKEGAVDATFTEVKQQAEETTATSKPTKVVTPILEEQGLAQYFDFIGGASMDESRDTKTEVVRYVLSQPALQGKRVLMVGDRNDDMRGAADCGLDAAGVLYGYGSREELEPFHPVLLAESCADLADRLLAARV